MIRYELYNITYHDGKAQEKEERVTYHWLSHSDSEGRSRSRSRDRIRHHSPGMEEENNFKISPSRLQILSHVAHRYYTTSENKSIGLPYVVWNLAVKYASRPYPVLVVCESMAQMAIIAHARRLNRSVCSIDENDQAT